MSIIIGIISETCALVASDGRIFSGATFVNGIRTNDAIISNEEFDKTFKLNDGRIIGCVSGLMKFQDKTIEEHLQEIINNNTDSSNLLIDVITKSLKVKIENISSIEVGFSFRKIDLILIMNSDIGALNDLKLYAIRIKPNSINNAIEFEKVDLVPQLGQVTWQLFGDTEAQKIIVSFLNDQIKQLKLIDEKPLRSLLYKAIRLGIKYSLSHPDGYEQSCGGKVFVKSL